MKKTKFVTMYYAYHSGEPIWGKPHRENWYKFSLASICNLGSEIICYTDFHDKGEFQLNELKERFKLDNLTIKTFDISKTPYQNKIENIRHRNPEKYLHDGFYFSHSPQIYWTKFDILKWEFEADINLYWIDCGLSHSGLFPLYNRKPEEEYGYYAFHNFFNPEATNRINNYNDGKIINMGRIGMTNNNMAEFGQAINEELDFNYFFPVGGFFGGNSNLMPQYINELKKVIDKVICSAFDYICNDEQIIAYVNYKNKNWVKNWIFDEFNPCIPNKISFCDFFTEKLK